MMTNKSVFYLNKTDLFIIHIVPYCINIRCIEMPKKKQYRHYKKINSDFLGFKFPQIRTCHYLSPGFSRLEKYIGYEALTIVMNILEYDEWRDTKYCNGFRCQERLFKSSSRYYCNSCWNQFKDDGFKLCFTCGVLKNECFHCHVCNKLDCNCMICT